MAILATNDSFNRMTVDPGKCGGNPCIRGRHITVRRILELLATDPDRLTLLDEYSFLQDKYLEQALRYAAATIDDELIDLHRLA